MDRKEAEYTRLYTFIIGVQPGTVNRFGRLILANCDVWSELRRSTQHSMEGLPPLRKKWYKVMMMAEPDDLDSGKGNEEQVPIGIARLRKEWRAAGLTERDIEAQKERVEPVLFPEVNGGAGVGDYTLDCDTVRDSLMLSQDAMDRLIDSGELDSILVQGPDGVARRLVSVSSFKRFQEDSAIDPGALKRAAKAMADQTVAQSIEELRGEIEELRATQGKVLQQMKDMLLLEVRNLKEQDRDLASYVYELAEEIRAVLPKKRKSK